MSQNRAYVSIVSRQAGQLRFEMVQGDPSFRLHKFGTTYNTTKLPTADFTIAGRKLSTGRFDIEQIEIGDKITAGVKTAQDTDFRLCFTGEVAHTELIQTSPEDADLMVHGVHPFWRWTEGVISMPERSGERHLKDVLDQMAQSAGLGKNSVVVSEAADVTLTRVQASRIPAFHLVKFLFLKYGLYGMFELDGTLSVRTYEEELQLFLTTPPVEIGGDNLRYPLRRMKGRRHDEKL
ncbi:hypothetical protein [Nannocystis bainbridge]|uniref:Uncharacterized protein n=1 Tax=Nannocystis bainbridge TaxID=2995303 RepID=A0ABT5DPV7_9BACT|nr:hypothetical protein [Nannocystis bainbridge]MDC0715687.1 hypothetical protein [Nannocystis bainbridge]